MAQVIESNVILGIEDKTRLNLISGNVIKLETILMHNYVLLYVELKIKIALHY